MHVRDKTSQRTVGNPEVCGSQQGLIAKHGVIADPQQARIFGIVGHQLKKHNST
jgi:hypothetical protein